MGYIDTSAHEEAFGRFLAGEEFYSPEPEPVDEISTMTLRGLQRRVDNVLYGNRMLVIPQLDGGAIMQPNFPLEEGSELYDATHTFCRAASTKLEEVDLRFGQFKQRRRPEVRQRGIIFPHIDTRRSRGDAQPAPVYTSSMCVGRPTRAFVGTCRRSKDHPNVVVPIRGKEVRLREGVVYRFGPLCAHLEPPAGWRPDYRYFWRHFHTQRGELAA